MFFKKRDLGNAVAKGFLRNEASETPSSDDFSLSEASGMSSSEDFLLSKGLESASSEDFCFPRGWKVHRPMIFAFQGVGKCVV